MELIEADKNQRTFRPVSDFFRASGRPNSTQDVFRIFFETTISLTSCGHPLSDLMPQSDDIIDHFCRLSDSIFERTDRQRGEEEGKLTSLIPTHPLSAPATAPSSSHTAPRATPTPRPPSPSTPLQAAPTVLPPSISHTTRPLHSHLSLSPTLPNISSTFLSAPRYDARHRSSTKQTKSESEAVEERPTRIGSKSPACPSPLRSPTRNTDDSLTVPQHSAIADLKRIQPQLDVSLEAKAVKVLESVDLADVDSTVAFLNMLLSCAKQMITTAAMKMLGNLFWSCSANINLTFAKADLIPRLIITLNPQSLSLTEPVDIHINLMRIIRLSLWLATPNGLSCLRINDRNEELTVHETVLKQFSPSIPPPTPFRPISSPLVLSHCPNSRKLNPFPSTIWIVLPCQLSSHPNIHFMMKTFHISKNLSFPSPQLSHFLSSTLSPPLLSPPTPLPPSFILIHSSLHPHTPLFLFPPPLCLSATFLLHSLPLTPPPHSPHPSSLSLPPPLIQPHTPHPSSPSPSTLPLILPLSPSLHLSTSATLFLSLLPPSTSTPPCLRPPSSPPSLHLSHLPPSSLLSHLLLLSPPLPLSSLPPPLTQPLSHTLAHPSSLLPPSTSHTANQPHTRLVLLPHRPRFKQPHTPFTTASPHSSSAHPPFLTTQTASSLPLTATHDTDLPQNQRSLKVMPLRSDQHGSARPALPALPRTPRTPETPTILQISHNTLRSPI
ncbi:hypothetical protein BLNAU_14250 [Blattamonas nauphoetae]|uniref:Uncharacterized protein n=1 Tax=Blattamonas nauphoetae TaxID=2049346 RepID=A0ABQ9XJR0_9EUKA|nr:hypothetical protein BLNAU_14250 [Blattamonas nauphoetae]